MLPELPRVLKKREAEATTPILKWFRENYKHTCAIEIKVTTGNKIARGALKDHQKLALAQVSLRPFTHKISDAGRVRQPFDAFHLVGAEAFVVACFTKNRMCFAVPIDKWRGISASPLPSEYQFSFKYSS